jgi:hypothetical protein
MHCMPGVDLQDVILCPRLSGQIIHTAMVLGARAVKDDGDAAVLGRRPSHSDGALLRQLADCGDTAGL